MRPRNEATDSVHAGHRATSANMSQTTEAGASTSMLLSVIMYQMVRLLPTIDKAPLVERARRPASGSGGAASRTRPLEDVHGEVVALGPLR